MEPINFSRFRAQWKAYEAFQPGHTITDAWGRGCGKSWFLRYIGWYLQVAKYDGIKRTGAKHPGVRINHLMPTLEQSRRVNGALMQAELESEWAFLGGHLNKQSWTVSFPGGSYIQWITAERAQSQRGLRGDILTCDEADDIEPGVFDSVTGPFFSEPHSLKQMLLGGTPRRGRKGALWRYYHDLPRQLPDKYTGIHATCWDAIKAGVIDEDYVRQMQAVTPEAIFKREWECDFDAAEGIIFSTFREDFHVRQPPEGAQWTDMFYVADHGYEDPGVILLIGQLGAGQDATYWVIDEVYEQHREPDWWLDKVRERVEWYPQAKWYPDPARPDLCKSWKRAGARVQDVIKYAGSIEDGIDIVKRALHIRRRPDGAEYAKFYVSENCPRTIDEFQLYKRKRDSRDPDVFLEDIVDNHNHCFAAGTMVQTEGGEKAIESVLEGERVYTRHGLRAVHAAGLTRPAPVPTSILTLSNGATIEATPEHRFWVENTGWVRMDSLRYGDILIPWVNREATQQKQPSESCIGASFSDAIRSLKTTATACISALKMAATCIARSTNTTTGPFLKATTSITWMETRTTMTSATSNACSQQTIIESTLMRHGRPSALLGNANTSQPFDLSQLLGTVARQASRGILETLKQLTQNAFRSCASVISAKRSSTVSRAVQLTGSAATTANQNGDAHLDWMTSNSHAPNAASSSPRTSTKSSSHVHVVAVSSSGRSVPVYCLTVDEHHEFFANGVLVANCIDSIRYGFLTRLGYTSRKIYESGEARQ